MLWNSSHLDELLQRIQQFPKYTLELVALAKATVQSDLADPQVGERTLQHSSLA